MSAERTRILFGDDSALADARPEVIARPDFDVVLAATTSEAQEIASLEPRPRVAILPASGAIDGVAVCRQLKSANPDIAVVLALSPEEISKRDACFVAGADDVIFSPADAGEIAARLEARVQPAFRGAPRASVPIAVHLQGSLTGPVVECRGTQISREALMIQMPAGIPVPKPNTLVRAIFTLYEGGTLTVWARFSAPADTPPRPALRFVGLSEQELRALDYFIDFYLKSASARAAVEEVTDEVTRETAAKQAGIDANVRTVTGRTNIAPVADLVPSTATLAQVANAGLDAIASAAATTLVQGNAPPPEGFSVLRFRQLLAKLAGAETAALKGQSTYGDTAGDIMLTASAKLRLFEMIAQVKTAGPNLDKAATESLVYAAIGEAQQVHKRLEGAVQTRVKRMETDAVKELGMLNVGLVNVCFELKRIVDTDVLGKGGAAAPASAASAAPAAAPVAPARFEKKASEKGKEKGKEKEAEKRSEARTAPAPGSGKGRAIALTVLLLAAAGGALWFNWSFFVHPPPPAFVAPHYLYAIGPVRVMFESADDRTKIFVVDDSWKQATGAEQNAALTEMASRAAQEHFLMAQVMTATGQRLESKPAALLQATPAETAPAATPTTAAN